MSGIVSALNGQKAEEERKRKLEQLSEAMSRIGVQFGLSQDELVDALRQAVEKKQLRTTYADINAIKKAGITK